MPAVPRYGSQQVQATGIPNVHISDGGVTAETFGAGIGRAIGQFAQVGEQIANQEREKADTAALMEAQTALSRVDLDLLNDPDHGALAKQGKDAIGLHETVLPEWDKRASDIVGALPSRLQTRAQQYVMQRRESATERVMAHSLREGDRYYAERAQSTVATFQSEAVANRNDPKLVDKSVDQAMQAAEEWGRLQGLSDEGRALLRRSTASTAYRGTVEALAQDDPLGAEKRYADVRAYMTPADQLEVEKIVRPLALDREDMADLQRDMAGIGEPRTTFDGDVTKTPANTTLQTLSIEQRRALPYNAPELDGYAAHVEQEYDLPAGLINALKNAGERSNNGQVSPAGARGVMQFMPANLRKYGVTDASDPVQMIEAAGKYLRDTMRQYDGNVDAVIADYNGGPRQANLVKSGGQPTATETRDYVARVKGALGGVVTGQHTTVAVKPPASEVEHLRLIDEKYANNPVKRDRMRQLAHREWGMREAERVERDRTTSESIYEKIYAADPRSPLASILTKDEREWAIKEGRFDAFQSELQRRATGTDQVSDPDVLYGLEQSYYNAAKGNPAAQAGLRALNPYDPSLPLSRSDRARLANEQLALLSGDAKKADAARADWSTEEQRMSRGFGLLGFGAKPDSDKAKKQAFVSFYRLAEQSFVQGHGKKPDGAQADALLRSTVQAFAADPDNFVRKMQAADTLSSGQDLGGGARLTESDRVTVRNVLKARGIANPTEAQILAAAGHYFATSGAANAD